jgi:hypothetical protein
MWAEILKIVRWYVHHHERDAAYENVILHVVWEHDTEIYRKNNTEIPELNKYVDNDTIITGIDVSKGMDFVAAS